MITQLFVYNRNYAFPENVLLFSTHFEGFLFLRISSSLTIIFPGYSFFFNELY